MRGGAAGRNVGMKRKTQPAEGYRSSLRLQKQVALLEELILQEQQASEDTHAEHRLLANAILLHRVTHGFMHPLYQQWAQEDPTASHVLDGGRLSRLPLVQSNPNWEVLVQIACASSNMTRRLLSVTPERVRELAAFTLQDAWKMTKECAEGMVVLSELLLPDRYPSELVRPAGQQPAAAAQADGAPGAAAGGAADPVSPTELVEEVTEAAQQLLTRLQQYEALIHKLSISVSVLLGVQPTMLFELAGMDLETGKHRSPPAGHFLNAAKRLRLSGAQVTELLRIRQLSNRMVSDVRSTGMHLVGQIPDSFSVQTSLSAATSTGGPSAGLGQQGGAAQQQSVGTHRQHQEAGSLGSTEQQEQQGGVEDALLEQLMQQHVHNIADFLLVVQGNWVINVLTPWQHGLYTAACWPFQASMGALVEFAPVLMPDTSPPLQIDEAACPEAAAAAALGAELGYVGPQQAMQQRHDAMDAHLAWILHELGLLQQ